MATLARKRLEKATRRACQLMAAQYGVEKGLPLPENIETRLGRMLDPGETDAWVNAAVNKIPAAMEIGLLSAWAQGKIDGPETVDSLEQRARSADGLAKMLAKKGQDEAANKQRARAKELRDRKEKLK
jgi:hypothetical protein